MKSRFYIFPLLMFALSSPANADLSKRLISAKWSDGPFKGGKKSHSYDAQTGKCRFQGKVSDGPIKGDSWNYPVKSQNCEPLILAHRIKTQLGSCPAHQEEVDEFDGGPFKGGSVTLELTQDCICKKTYYGSYGPFKGETVEQGTSYTDCKKFFKPERQAALDQLLQNTE